MQIKNDMLEGENIKYIESPNRSGLFGSDLPDTIVIHYTAGRSAESSIQTLCNPAAKASAHLVVGRKGGTTQLVPFNTIAWHAGRSSYEGRTGLNKYAIGIEIDNAGRLTKGPGGFSAWFGGLYGDKEVVEATHRNESTPSFWHRYSEEQIECVLALCYLLADTYPIKTIVGHEEISPGRKTDPGPAFPLDKTRDLVLKRDRAEEGQAEEWPIHMAGVVNATRLNIRSAPRLGAGTVAAPLSKGTMVDIRKASSGWYEVDVVTRGWVKKEYIKT